MTCCRSPDDRPPEQIRLELMATIHKLNESKRNRRGLSVDEYYDGTFIPPPTPEELDRHVSPFNRFVAWLERAWINLQLLRPGL